MAIKGEQILTLTLNTKFVKLPKWYQLRMSMEPFHIQRLLYLDSKQWHKLKTYITLLKNNKGVRIC